MLGETCTAAPASAFNFGAFLTSALVKKEVEFSPPSSSVESPEPKKRRRGELSNPANTLDGLVARRADDSREPFQKRFLSEQEAIEGPDDELEMKKMENDPDVSTRTCSTCGYQGKWVSEMIRHKRVHTAERPFKCRYCSRTSKWKADLIRHVAKTHGIRVVSKYSRSKTFDPTAALLSNRADEEKPRAYACEMGEGGGEGTLYRPEPLSPSRGRPLSYRCVQCLFEQEGLSYMINHLRTAHSSAPYECHCGQRFDDIETALAHAQKPSGCSSAELIVNITPIYNRKAASISSFSSISPSGSRGDSSPDNSLSNTETEEDDTRKCTLCPFEAVGQLELSAHADGHSSILPYKCYFCSWSTVDRPEVEAHMRLHCQYPAQFMAPVERNMTDSLLSLLNSPLDLTAAFLLLQQKMAPQYVSPLVSPLALMNLTTSAFTPVPKVKQHGCDRCDARFHDASSLSLHLAKHGSQSVFACPMCDYSSTRAANLVLHIQGHHSGGLVESQTEEPEDDVVDVETE